jgi:leader peptidase (prepilin peptidase)/N-methyltransferase
LNLKIFKTECKSTEKVFVGILGVSIFFSIYNSIYSTLPLPQIIIFYFILLVILYILFYISYVDFKTMEIDSWLTLGVILFLLVINISLYFLTNPNIGLVVSKNFSYIPYDNALFSLILAIPFLLIVLISKEKAMGFGDIRIAIIVGLLIGYSNSMLWVYITVFSTLLYGLILGYKKKKKFKDIKIPFAPFMILGAVLSLLIDMYI